MKKKETQKIQNKSMKLYNISIFLLFGRNPLSRKSW